MPTTNLPIKEHYWKNIEKIHTETQGPWCLIGDYNNVRQSQNRIGGQKVQELEYVYMVNMMEQIRLFKMDSIGDHFTWFNRHASDTIYSRIDRVLGNIYWFQQQQGNTLHIMEPGISGHAFFIYKSVI